MDIIGKVGKAYLPYLLGSKREPQQIPKNISDSAEFASLAYNKPEKRPQESQFGSYQPQFSNKDVAIYKKDKQLNVAIRGSDFSNPLSDLKGDIGVITGNLSKTERYQGVKNSIELAKKANPEAKVKSISHSLGASTGRELVKEGVIDKSMGFSEGLSPFVPQKEDPRIQSIRFKSDIISFPGENKGVISLDPVKAYGHGLSGFFNK
jgi:hypothetical protein